MLDFFYSAVNMILWFLVFSICYIVAWATTNDTLAAFSLMIAFPSFVFSLIMFRKEYINAYDNIRIEL